MHEYDGNIIINSGSCEVYDDMKRLSMRFRINEKSLKLYNDEKTYVFYLKDIKLCSNKKIETVEITFETLISLYFLNDSLEQSEVDKESKGCSVILKVHGIRKKSVMNEKLEEIRMEFNNEKEYKKFLTFNFGSIETELMKKNQLIFYEKVIKEAKKLSVQEYVKILNIIPPLLLKNETINSIFIINESVFNFNSALISSELVANEISGCDSSGLLFRNNSFSTKYLILYFKFFGTNYLINHFSIFIQNLIQDDLNLDIDPLIKDEESIKNNISAITKCIYQIFEILINSIGDFPDHLKYLLYKIKIESEKKFKSNFILKKDFGDISVGALFFLRFLCPSLGKPIIINDEVSPYSSFLSNEQPGENSSKTLLIISKIIQTLANGVNIEKKEDLKKEVILEGFIPIFKEMQNTIFEYLSNISQIDTTIKEGQYLKYTCVNVDPKKYEKYIVSSLSCYKNLFLETEIYYNEKSIKGEMFKFKIDMDSYRSFIKFTNYFFN
jgi:hypothetical protein